MKKNYSVEWLRGLASLGVCEMHLFCAGDYFSKSDLFFQKFIFPITILGRLGVPVFFVISGFVIPLSMWANNYTFKSWKNFIMRRLIRLEPPYILSIILILLVRWFLSLANIQPGFRIDWANLFLHLGYLNVFFKNSWLNGVYWTLAIEFQYYLLISLLFPLFIKSNRWIKVVANCVLVAVFYFISLHTSDQFIPYHFPLFMAGILTFQRIKNINELPEYLVQMAVVCGLIYMQHGLAYAGVTVLSAAVILINIDIKFKPVYFLGKISYSLYLMHWLIGVEIIRNLSTFYIKGQSEYMKVGIAFFGIIVSIAISYLYYNIIEKKSITWGKALKA
jgi:peptidoglycan/LPS O-acetylase OafA/YrhL